MLGSGELLGDDEPNRGLDELELGAVKSVTDGDEAAGAGFDDTGILNPSVSLVLLTFVLGVVGDVSCMKIIMQELGNKHNHFKMKLTVCYLKISYKDSKW
jgi:hypothetical protein